VASPCDITQFPEFEVAILVGASGLNPANGNVDVEVRFKSGVRLAATFFTLANIDQLMRTWGDTGECSGGAYFWARFPIIVRSLTKRAILDTVVHLHEVGELERAFEPLPEDV
jgi:hypothetical protein